MCSSEQTLKDSQTQVFKRSSINNLFTDKNDKSQKANKSPDRSFENSIRLKKKLNINFEQHKFQPFDLTQLESNKNLIKNNKKFSSMLTSLKQYNKKLINKKQKDIVNYKLNQFFYSTLRICNIKTDSEVNLYLKQVDAWFNLYNQRRQFMFYPKKKKNYKLGQQDIVRQTFVSNMPLEIDQYDRKIFTIHNHSDPNALNQSKRGQKVKSTAGRFNFDSQQSDSQQYIKKIKDEQSDQPKDQRNLPNLRQYRNQLLKMRKVIQQRQQKKLFYDMRKNKSRIQTQTSNNFYKQMRNRNDIFHKTSNLFNKQDSQINSKKIIGEDDSHQSSKRQSNEQLQRKRLDRQKQNLNIIVNSTSLGINQIKKKNLNHILGVKPSKKQEVFPRFFTKFNVAPGDFYYDEKNTKDQINLNGQKMNQKQQSSVLNQCNEGWENINNISGIYLIRNPFEITKLKKQKKKK